MSGLDLGISGARSVIVGGSLLLSCPARWVSPFLLFFYHLFWRGFGLVGGDGGVDVRSGLVIPLPGRRLGEWNTLLGRSVRRLHLGLDP